MVVSSSYCQLEGVFIDSSPPAHYILLYTYLHIDTACLEKPLQINIQESSKVLLFTEISPLTYLDKHNFAVVTGLAVP